MPAARGRPRRPRGLPTAATTSTPAHLHRCAAPFRAAGTPPTEPTCESRGRRLLLACLNKVTLERADDFAARLLEDTRSPLKSTAGAGGDGASAAVSSFMSLLFEKALPEPLFCPAYAALVAALQRRRPGCGAVAAASQLVAALLDDATRLRGCPLAAAMARAGVVPLALPLGRAATWLATCLVPLPLPGAAPPNLALLEPACRLIASLSGGGRQPGGDCGGDAAALQLLAGCGRSLRALLARGALPLRLRFVAEDALAALPPPPPPAAAHLQRVAQGAVSQQPPQQPWAVAAAAAPADGAAAAGSVASLRAQLASLLAERCCAVCLERPRAAVLLPCRHACACAPCATALLAAQPAAARRCPLCRAPCDDALGFFG